MAVCGTFSGHNQDTIGTCPDSVLILGRLGMAAASIESYGDRLGLFLAGHGGSNLARMGRAALGLALSSIVVRMDARPSSAYVASSQLPADTSQVTFNTPVPGFD